MCQDEGRPAGRSKVRRGLTMADLLALVSGFAVAFAMPTVVRLGGPAHVFGSLPIWFVIGLTAAQIILWCDIATACVVVLRCFKYAVMPRPAEWLAVVLALWTFSQVVPSVDALINCIYRITGGSDDFGLWRWQIAAASTAIALAATLLLSVAWKRLAPLARTLLLSGIGFTLLRGPLAILSLQFDTLFPPITFLGDGWAFWLAQRPELPIAATVTFYAARGGDFARARCSFLCHFAERDDFVSAAARKLIRDLAAAERPATVHAYAGTTHWFFESDRADSFEAKAADLAWERTVGFFKSNLARGSAPAALKSHATDGPKRRS